MWLILQKAAAFARNFFFFAFVGLLYSHSAVVASVGRSFDRSVGSQVLCNPTTKER